MICYPAVIEYDRADGAYNVSFPDLPGCFTFGGTLEEAEENAKEALSAYLESIVSRNVEVPTASDVSGDNVFPIEPEASSDAVCNDAEAETARRTHGSSIC